MVACSHYGTVYADRPAAMPVPYSHAAGCQTSADLVIEYANMTACGIPMHRSDVICGSDTVDQLATENFGRPVQTWATEGIGGILTEQIKAVSRQAEYIGADETKFPVLEKDSESGTAHLLVCSTDPEQDRPFVVYEYMPSRQGQSIAAHLKNWEFRVLTRDGYEGFTAALREQSLETRDITTQVCPVHARRRICNAVNVDHFADITTQDNGAELAASRFEEHSPQYLLYMALTALRKLYGWEETKNRQKGESREQQLERILRFRREHCAAVMDSVDEIMMALAEKYAVERNGRWYLAREGSAIGKAVIFWLNNRKKLRSFLHDPCICPDNNQVERSVRAVALYRNAAFFKKSIEGTKGFCNLLTLRETAKLNGIKDVPKWLNAVHRAFYQHVERSVWTTRYERLKDGKPLRLCIPTITPELVASFDWRPWLPWNYASALPPAECCPAI